MSSDLIPSQPTAMSNSLPATNQVLSLGQVGSLMQMAIEKGIDLKELVALHRQLKADAAEQAYNEAIQRFQAEVPTVPHDKKASIKEKGTDNEAYAYTFASLARIAETIKPLMNECGLTYAFDTNIEDGLLEVTCTITHVLGHSKKSTFKARPSGSPKMSEIQRSASTITTGQRYALKLGLGLMTVDTDNDGRGYDEPHQNPTPNDQAPRAPSREQRKQGPPKPPEDPVLAKRLAEIKRIKGLWFGDLKKNDPIAAMRTDDLALMFQGWCRVVSKLETLNPYEAAAWGPAEDEAFERCSIYFQG